MVGQDHHVRAGLKLGVDRGDGHGHELAQHPDDLSRFTQADLKQEVLGAGHVIGKGPGAHDLADDGGTATHVAAQKGKGVQHHPHGRLFQEVLRDLDIGEVRVGEVLQSGMVSRSPQSYRSPEGGGFLVNAVFGHDGIEPDDFMAGQGQLQPWPGRPGGPPERKHPASP